MEITVFHGVSVVAYLHVQYDRVAVILLSIVYRLVDTDTSEIGCNPDIPVLRIEKKGDLKTQKT